MPDSDDRDPIDPIDSAGRPAESGDEPISPAEAKEAVKEAVDMLLLSSALCVSAVGQTLALFWVESWLMWPGAAFVVLFAVWAAQAERSRRLWRSVPSG